MSELRPIRFDCHGGFAPAYTCSEPGDMSGTYYQAADAQDLIDGLIEALDLIANNPLRPDVEQIADAALAKARGEQP